MQSAREDKTALIDRRFYQVLIVGLSTFVPTLLCIMSLLLWHHQLFSAGISIFTGSVCALFLVLWSLMYIDIAQGKVWNIRFSYAVEYWYVFSFCVEAYLTLITSVMVWLDHLLPPSTVILLVTLMVLYVISYNHVIKLTTQFRSKHLDDSM